MAISETAKANGAIAGLIMTIIAIASAAATFSSRITKIEANVESVQAEQIELKADIEDSQVSNKEVLTLLHSMDKRLAVLESFVQERKSDGE